MTFATGPLKNHWSIAVISLLLVLQTEDVCRSDEISDVKSLISRKCLSCHHGEEAKGKLALTTRESIFRGGESGPAIVGNSSSDSLLWQRIEQNEMPPKHPLNDAEKQIIKQWISSGSQWTGDALDPLAISSEHRAGLDWWSLQPIHEVAIPKIESPSNRRQPIDDFILNKLVERNLLMSDEADRRILIRRISFDLLGLPPTPDEVEQFVQDPRPDAYERLVDRLLASPHFGERWARHWLDVVRFGESNGFERDLPRPNAWHYRDWVINALNRDMPYDEFVRWQLAGDLLQPENPDAIKATGFLVAGAHDTVVPVFDSMRATMRQDELEDIVGTVGQTFLGLTVNCARCHDHKFDPISTREYYQIASALSGIDHGEREIVPVEVTTELNSIDVRISELTRLRRDQAAPIHEAIIADRVRFLPRASNATQLPAPIASWDFRHDLYDQAGDLDVSLKGSAKRTSQGLVCDANSFGKTPPLKVGLSEKTLEVRLQLKTLDQSGGGAISVQSLDGKSFDAIVYAEQEPGRWMAGSDGFQRSLPFEGTAEEWANASVVTITMVYRADGTILAYRNGKPYGHAVRKNSAINFEAGQSHLIFGMRHGTESGGNRMLAATIAAARVFDKALTPDEVAISAEVINAFTTEAEILSKLTAEQASIRKTWQKEIDTLKARRADLAKKGQLPIYTAIATQASPMKIHRRGSVMSLGDEVPAGGIAAVQGLSPEFGLRPNALESYRRRNLANWVTDPRNPLFIRTMVNRTWHYHFGAGLIESPNDLGFHGGLPSHPELLEWLSGEFRSFSVKRLHRLMVTSAAYRQSSAFNSEAAKIDASNRYLWRTSPRRLEAEEVRDAMLMISDQLNSTVGGKGYSDVNSYFFKGTQFYDPIDPAGYESHRRTVYRMWARGGRSPFLDTFDCPDPSTTTPRRSATVTPLQALSLLNHPFSLRMSEHFAQRLADESGGFVKNQIRIAYRSLFSRDPDAEEIQLSRDFISRRGLSEFCRAMWNSSEFLFVD